MSFIGYAPYVSAAASLLGGLISSNAAKSAAQTQAQSARDANALLLQMYQQTRSDQAPYREAGYHALLGLLGYAGQPMTLASLAQAQPGLARPVTYNNVPVSLQQVSRTGTSA